MCGRYATARSAPDIAAFFDAYDDTPAPLAPSWNVAPTDPVPVVRMSRRRDARVVSLARWGLVPAWAADSRGAARMINARAETVASSAAYGPSFARRRCLVPADGWFEWARRDGVRHPHYLTPREASPLAFAGLWSAWGDGPLLTCTIVTTAARGPLTEIHDRMPLVLPPDRWGRWLTGPADQALLAPPPDAVVAGIEIRPVSAAVGNVRNNGPELIAEVGGVDERPDELTLF
jgi:putative SOS response-associated peptidase YedK